MFSSPETAKDFQDSTSTLVRIALPKGRIEAGVQQLLRDAGIYIRQDARGYRPQLSIPNFDAKILKPQNVVEMLHNGCRDIGFAGADWVQELKANVVELLDTKLDPVTIVAAAPINLANDLSNIPKSRELIVVSEYQNIAAQWIEKSGIKARFVRSYGATEVFPPEDADIIIDNTATGSTLRANQLAIIDEIMKSSTRLYANPTALDNPTKRQIIEDFLTLLRSVLEARMRAVLEINVPAEALNNVLDILPCMREPTIAPLRHNTGFAVKVAVPRDMLPTLIPRIKERGGTDILVFNPEQIVR